MKSIANNLNTLFLTLLLTVIFSIPCLGYFIDTSKEYLDVPEAINDMLSEVGLLSKEEHSKHQLRIFVFDGHVFVEVVSPLVQINSPISWIKDNNTLRVSFWPHNIGPYTSDEASVRITVENILKKMEEGEFSVVSNSILTNILVPLYESYKRGDISYEILLFIGSPIIATLQNIDGNIMDTPGRMAYQESLRGGNHLVFSSAKFDLTEEQVLKIFEKIKLLEDKVKTEEYKYNFLRQNCAEFPQKIFEELDLPGHYSDYFKVYDLTGMAGQYLTATQGGVPLTFLLAILIHKLMPAGY